MDARKSLFWEVTDWGGQAGEHFDQINSTGEILIQATEENPIVIEVAQGTDPTDSESKLPLTVDFTLEGPALKFQVRELLPGFALGLEMSNDLIGWSPGLSQANDGTFQPSDNTAFEIQTARENGNILVRARPVNLMNQTFFRLMVLGEN
jgi:hypothetical protein